MDNPHCGTCGMLNSRGFCSLTACRFPVGYTAVVWAPPPRTNADRIRSMTDEELASCLQAQPWNKRGFLYTNGNVLEWLKQEIE